MSLQNFLKNILSPSSSPEAIGLDIGNFSVKMAYIKKSHLSKDRVLSFAVVPVKGNGGRDEVIKAIKEAYKQINPDSKKANFSVCGPSIITRYLIMPNMKEKDLARSLDFELERYVPYKKEDVITDCRSLARLSNGKIIVLLVAAERRIVRERANLVKEAGLEPLSINVDALALGEAFKALANRPKGVVAILDVGYKISKLAVLDNDIPYFSRDIEIGKYNIIQTVSKRMGIKFDSGEGLEYGLENNTAQEAAKVTSGDISNLLDELSLSFEYCERNLEKKVEQLYLTGGSSKINILLDSLNKMPNLKLDFLEAAQGFKTSTLLMSKELKQYSSLLNVAVGLALT